MTTETEAIEALVRRTTSVVAAADGREFAVISDDQQVTEIAALDEHGLHRKKPAYIAQQITLRTKASLIEYVNKYKLADTTLFADVDSARIVAVIDYHWPTAAEHAAHRAVLQLKVSEQWQAWNAISGKLLPQLDFARFLEEHRADITRPPFADLLEAVRDLQATKKVTFNKAIRTASGTERFEYLEENSATKDGVELPTEFGLLLPVFFGELVVAVKALLRWKIGDGELLLGIKLDQAQTVIIDAFNQVAGEVEHSTECLTLDGSIGGSIV